MSQTAAVRTARPVPRPATRASGRPAGRSTALRVAAAPAQVRSRAPLMIGSLLALAAGLVGLLLVNVSLERGAFVLRQQQTDTNRLLAQRQALQEELAALEAPAALAARAQALGMVEAPNVAFVRTSDGRVLGVPTPGVASSTTAPGVPAASSGPKASSPTTPSPKPSSSTTANKGAGQATPTKVTAGSGAAKTTAAEPTP